MVLLNLNSEQTTVRSLLNIALAADGIGTILVLFGHGAFVCEHRSLKRLFDFRWKSWILDISPVVISSKNSFTSKRDENAFDACESSLFFLVFRRRSVFFRRELRHSPNTRYPRSSVTFSWALLTIESLRCRINSVHQPILADHFEQVSLRNAIGYRYGRSLRAALISDYVYAAVHGRIVPPLKFSRFFFADILPFISYCLLSDW